MGLTTPPYQLGDGTALSLVAGPPKNMIMDSQWITDVDEYLALRILAWAHSIGLIKLLAVTNCFTNTSVTDPDAPQIVSQILTTQRVSGVLLAAGPTTTNVSVASTTVGAFLAQAFSPARRLTTGLGLNTAVPVLRSALAAATSPVDIFACGTGNNLYDLLLSPADAISPLTGQQLIIAKVGTLYWEAGQYPAATALAGAEYNFGNVPGATGTLWPVTDYLLKFWPTPIVFEGYELGVMFSCGAQNYLTATDPIGYLYGVDDTFKYGRQGWASSAALIALKGPAFAGFSTVTGQNTINTATGFNTFVPGPGGAHQYVVPLVGQRAIQQAVDGICNPGITQPTAFVPVAYTPITSPNVSGATDATNLIAWYFANDVALANGASVPLWPDRCGRANLVQATALLQPTYNTAKNGKVAVVFAAEVLQTDVTLDLPHDCSMYAYVECDDFSATQRGVLAHSTPNGATVQYGLFMRRSLTTDPVASAPEATSAIQNTYTSIDAALSATVSTWQVFCIVRKGANLIAYLAGASPGTVQISVPGNFLGMIAAVSNHILGPLTVGASGVLGAAPSQPWSGGVREVRVYNNAHTPAMVATVSAEMAT